MRQRVASIWLKRLLTALSEPDEGDFTCGRRVRWQYGKITQSRFNLSEEHPTPLAMPLRRPGLKRQNLAADMVSQPNSAGCGSY